MYQRKIKYFVPVLALVTLVTVATLATQLSSARSFENSNGPELPPQCVSIQVAETEKLAFHVYARGVQIYKWNATTFTWDFDALAPRCTPSRTSSAKLAATTVDPVGKARAAAK
ncbi:MAG TPA: hypothetical protein VGJ37_07155 [Pyrinomonadaceae bacterium]|jgi:hypothetical protein